jgi:hypothetical protein
VNKDTKHRRKRELSGQEPIVWRDRMGVPSEFTIVKAIGRTAHRLRATEQPAVGTEGTLIAMLKTHKRKDCIPCL